MHMCMHVLCACVHSCNSESPMHRKKVWTLPYTESTLNGSKTQYLYCLGIAPIHKLLLRSERKNILRATTKAVVTTPISYYTNRQWLVELYVLRDTFPQGWMSSEEPVQEQNSALHQYLQVHFLRGLI